MNHARSAQANINMQATTSVASRMLERKCACGQQKSGQSTECSGCKKKRLTLQRKAANHSNHTEVPPIVHDVLRTPGRPLDQTTRNHLEPRFGRDLSGVRVHSDAKATKSAQSINALAYTFGRDIVFDEGQYTPETEVGQRILGHELTHVLQQQHQPRTQLPNFITSPHNHLETEADDIASRVTEQKSLPPISSKSSSGLMRKLKVNQPAELIPNPGGQGIVRTNAETIEGYLRTLSRGGNVTVNRTSGEVSMDTGYCPGFVGGLVQGARSAYDVGYNIGSIGGRIPLLGPLIGGLFGLFGAIGGAIGGLFGANLSQAESSTTPTGSQCLCDFVNSGPETVIEINDEEGPAGAATLVRVPSPNSQREYGSATVSGQLRINEPWLILAHELCGHAWLAIHSSRDEEGRENQAPSSYSQDSRTGQVEIVPDYQGQLRQPRAGQFLRHGRTVERENLIRREHGIEARGSHLRDPYCGESFWRQRGVSNAPRTWQRSGAPDPIFESYLRECEFLRSQLPESRRRRYRIDERIP